MTTTNDNDGGGRRARLTAAQKAALELYAAHPDGLIFTVTGKLMTPERAVVGKLARVTYNRLREAGLIADNYSETKHFTDAITAAGRTALAGETATEPPTIADRIEAEWGVIELLNPPAASAEVPAQRDEFIWWVDQNNNVFHSRDDGIDLWNAGCEGPFLSEEVARNYAEHNTAPEPTAPDEAATRQHRTQSALDRLIDLMAEYELVRQGAPEHGDIMLDLADWTIHNADLLRDTLRAALSRPAAGLAVQSRVVVEYERVRASEIKEGDVIRHETDPANVPEYEFHNLSEDVAVRDIFPVRELGLCFTLPDVQRFYQPDAIVLRRIDGGEGGA